MRWWIEEPRLLGSSNLSDAELRELSRQGFTVIVSLLCDEDQPPNYKVDGLPALGFKRYSIPIPDGARPSLAHLDEFVDLLRRLPDGAKVVLHCEGGCGRTGTFAAAYRVAKGLSTPKAVAAVRKSNPCAIETRGQERALEEFARHADRDRHKAIQTLAKLVALSYREIGVLDQRNHPTLAAKRNLGSGFFITPTRKKMAREIYQSIASLKDSSAILAAFEKRTGLSLGDVDRAFREGRWQNASGGYSFGGPKWAAVTRVALSLIAAVQDDDLFCIRNLLEQVPSLEHNNGKIFDKFRELDSR